MGACGSSGCVRPEADHRDLCLPSTGLRFGAGQMRRLNDNLLRGYENSDDLPSSSTSLNVEAIVNRIVQRLLCGIGMLDRRFASKFLVTAEPMTPSAKLSDSFGYYVRLDVLSEPKLYGDDRDECPVKCVMEEDGSAQGFGKIRIVTDEPGKWADLTDGDGYLRSDKVKLRFVELLATSASKNDLVGRPEDVDESYLCGCPGKVVDAGLLHEILKSPADEHVFFGTGSTGSSAFPDPRDLRIAVVEDAQCVKLRVSVPKTTGDIAIVLMPAVEFRGWPKRTDLLSRIPVTHPDVLVHQRAATTGYYAVPVAPHRAARRGRVRQTAWQMRMPAAECLYQTHYSERSVIGNIHHFLRTKVPRLRNGRRGVDGGGGGGVRVASGYALRTLLWFRLEACDRVEDWHHGRAAEHVLSVLDALVAALKARRHRSYFWPGADVVLDAARACRTAVPDDDCQHDVEIVEAYLYGLFERSMDGRSMVAGRAFRDADADRWHDLESVVLRQWRRVLDAVGRAPHAFRYTTKQAEYVGEVFAGVLAAGRCVTSGDSRSAWRSLTDDKVPWAGDGGAADETGLDAAYLVLALTERALAERAPAERTAAVRRLLRDVRAGAATADIADDADLVRYALGRLHAAAASDDDATPFARRWRRGATTRRRDRDRLGPSLAPFLRRLYDSSHATCWHLDEWRRRHDRDELRSLGAFARLLCRDAAPPTEALLDAVDKGSFWSIENRFSKSRGPMNDVELDCQSAVCQKGVRPSYVETERHARARFQFVRSRTTAVRSRKSNGVAYRPARPVAFRRGPSVAAEKRRFTRHPSVCRMDVGRQIAAGRRGVPGRRGHRLRAEPGPRAPFHRIGAETRTGIVRVPQPGPGGGQTTLFRPGGHGVQQVQNGQRHVVFGRGRRRRRPETRDGNRGGRVRAPAAPKPHDRGDRGQPTQEQPPRAGQHRRRTDRLAEVHGVAGDVRVAAGGPTRAGAGRHPEDEQADTKARAARTSTGPGTGTGTGGRRRVQVDVRAARRPRPRGGRHGRPGPRASADRQPPSDGGRADGQARTVRVRVRGGVQPGVPPRRAVRATVRATVRQPGATAVPERDGRQRVPAAAAPVGRERRPAGSVNTARRARPPSPSDRFLAWKSISRTRSGDVTIASKPSARPRPVVGNQTISSLARLLSNARHVVYDVRNRTFFERDERFSR